MIESGGYVETWTVRKPAVASRRGLVASQHHLASEIGAGVLREGGNAVDAVVSAALAIGAVEPWMSGLGGGGYLLVHPAGAASASAVDFSMVAPAALDPADYPVVRGADNDLFGWPAVLEDRNVHGPWSFAVPGAVAGYATALERFGTLSFADALAPAIGLAARGMDADWYATLKIAAAAPVLARYPESARVYLPQGHPPASQWGGMPPRLRLGNLHATLERLAAAGPRDFYEGELARDVLADTEALGSSLAPADLARYEPRVVEAQAVGYRDATVWVGPRLTAGPTLARALGMLERRLAPAGSAPDAGAYRAYADCLTEAYAERLETLGDDTGSDASPACTTHLSVVDEAGTIAVLTQTLLSVFGSKVVLPRTGVLMNNGIMWFDPRPGRPNSIRPGRRPLANMCPAVLAREDGVHAGLGASGGRRIMPAVFQLLSFLVDFRMSLDAAMHTARVDASGTDVVTVDETLGSEVLEAVGAAHPVQAVRHGVYPALFACPNVVARDAEGLNTGAAFVMSPWAAVATA